MLYDSIRAASRHNAAMSVLRVVIAYHEDLLDAVAARGPGDTSYAQLLKQRRDTFAQLRDQLTNDHTGVERVLADYGVLARRITGGF